jgi:hypothetical protein
MEWVFSHVEGYPGIERSERLENLAVIKIQNALKVIADESVLRNEKLI